MATDPLGEAVGIAPATPVPDYLAAQAPPAPAPITPGMGMIAPAGIPAAQILSGGTSADLARQAAALVPPPDPVKVRDAGQAYSDAVQNYLRTGEDYRKSYDARANEVDLAAQEYQDKAQKLLPQQQGIPAPPPRSLRAFLAPTENEDPYTTVSKFMQSVSLLATMMGGGRNGARAAVSAMTGAVEGWTKGDRYRADSEYQTWKDTTEALFRQFDDEMRQYNSIMIAERVPLEQKLRALETIAWREKNAMAAEAFKVGQAKDAVDHLEKMRQAAVQAQFHAATIEGGRERMAQQREIDLARLEEAGKYHQQLAAAAEARVALQQQVQQLQLQQVQGVQPDTLAAMGKDYFLTGKMPALATGRNLAGNAMKLKIIEAGQQWAKDNGLDPMAGQGIRAELDANVKAKKELEPKLAVQRASIGRLDAHISRLIELSDKLDRSEIPAINQALLSGALNYSGSPAAAAYFQQVNEVAAEQAKVQSGTGVGDAKSRDEVRQAFAASYNKEQMRAAALNAQANAHRSLESNEATSDHYTKVIDRLQGAKTPEVRKDVSAAETPKAAAPAPAAAVEPPKTFTINGKTVTVTRTK